ncbi:MAG: DUF4965 domain-containing protein [Armatimonadetes bacterium]|nr:DUF4965 domain-containing protein [Armatimonadota bacterium]MDE2206347.1 DUF4965 domain-containing protein [Armatimonadota bacterium]
MTTLFAFCVAGAAAQQAPIRPPATPLIVRNPYVSVWQPSNTLPGTWPAFWTGSTRAITGIARIDGEPYAFIGAPGGVILAMNQVSLKVTATQSIYTLERGGIRLTLRFLSPVEATDLRRLSMPFGTISASAVSIDGHSHRVSLYFDISGEWASGDPSAKIRWQRVEQSAPSGGTMEAWDVTQSSPGVLQERSDAAEWGDVVFATMESSHTRWQAGLQDDVRPAGIRGSLTDTASTSMPRAINDHWPVFAWQYQLGMVGDRPTSPVTMLLGLARDPAVSYLGKPVPPLWKSYWPTWQAMAAFALSDARAAFSRAAVEDARVERDAMRAGGAHYAALCNLALRQAFGATELVGTRSDPWLLLKEISSDGNISTVDVVYPAFPAFLYTNPLLVRLLCEPLLDYAESGGWPKPFAEHDIGSSYPNANGHNDGREEDMPVEESANMLVLAAAYVDYAPGPSASRWAARHYKVLSEWADYEEANGLDPALQNQTDDFTGFIKSSSNLALKAILGVGAMGQIAKAAGHNRAAAGYLAKAREMMDKWTRLAQSTTAAHLTLAYGRNSTWSLKYNAFPDRVLRLDLIPDRVLREEAAWYASRENPFGIPLDVRHSYTKTDWELWTAASTDDLALRQAIIDAVYRFANTSGFRGAFSDWYDTISGQQVGFVARPVIGGVFAILDRRMADRTAGP